MARGAAPSLQSDQAALVRPIAVATRDLDARIIAGTSPFPAPFPVGHECVTKGITFATGRAHVRAAMPQVLELAHSGVLHPEHVTTSTVEWTDVPEALTSGHWTKLVFRRD